MGSTLCQKKKNTEGFGYSWHEAEKKKEGGKRDWGKNKAISAALSTIYHAPKKRSSFSHLSHVSPPQPAVLPVYFRSHGWGWRGATSAQHCSWASWQSFKFKVQISDNQIFNQMLFFCVDFLSLGG